MAVSTRRKTQLTYEQVMRAIEELSPEDQRRLRDQLNAAPTGVYLARPTSTEDAVQRGQQLAETIRAALATTADDSLDETMARLRGSSRDP